MLQSDRNPKLAAMSWEEQFLFELLHISSSTSEKLGVQEVQERTAEVLRELGFETRLLPTATDKYGPLLLAEKRGQKKEFVTFITHADTVLPYSGFQREDGVWKASGAIDNKGGLTVAVAGLRNYIQKFKNENLSIRFVSSPNEEVGSIDWTDSYQKWSLDTWMALGFEPALDDGSIIHARRGNRWYHIKVKGQEAHAGRSYGEHVNAAHELAWKIHRMQKLTNYSSHRSVNVGHISGGRDRYNVVCGFAEAKLDVRFLTFRDREKLHQRIVKLLEREKHPSTCGRYVPKTTFEITDDCPPFAPGFSSRKWIKKYSAAIEAIEKKHVASQLAGGAGDVNYFSRPGVIVLDGLGAFGGKMHTEDEFIQVDSLRTRSEALAQFLASI